MAGVPEIRGECDSRFRPVLEAFERNFRDHREVGAAVAVTIDGQPVVDLWAGQAHHDRPWERDTIVNVYSTTKGMAALCAHLLADRGILDFDAPVTRYWPEFGQAGKSEMPVRYLLTHQAGLPTVDGDVEEGMALDWDGMVRRLEATRPAWIPGTRQGYHAVTFGWLVGEVVRRASGASSLGAFFRDEVAKPLGVDFFIGTPASEDHRIANLISAQRQPAGEAAGTEPRPARPQLPPMAQAMLDPNSLAARSLGLANARAAAHNNSREWRAAEIPGANGHGNARALARIYGALARGGEVDGVRLMSPASVDRARQACVEGADAVLTMKTRRSLGYMLPVAEQGDRRGPQAFGHAGAGGSLGYADPEQRIGFGYVMNQMWQGGFMNPDPRAQSLVAAVHRSLGLAS